MGAPDLTAQIRTLVQQWPDVAITARRLGGVDFRVRGRAFGHLHGQGVLDLPFSVRMRRELVAAGRAEAHHTLGRSGWVTFRIRTEHDIPAAVQLLRSSYARVCGHEMHTPMSQFLHGATLLASHDGGDFPA